MSPARDWIAPCARSAIVEGVYIYEIVVLELVGMGCTCAEECSTLKSEQHGLLQAGVGVAPPSEKGRREHDVAE